MCGAAGRVERSWRTSRRWRFDSARGLLDSAAIVNRWPSHHCLGRRIAALILTLAPLAVAPAGVSAGALALGFLAHGHGHQLSLSGDAGHVDLVLHHPHESEAAAKARELADPTVDRHDGDHVVHLASADSSRAPAKRAPAPLGAVALSTPVGLALRSVAAPNRPLILARGRPAALLRTIVLRV